jgi:hypothetical protein
MFVSRIVMERTRNEEVPEAVFITVVSGCLSGVTFLTLHLRIHNQLWDIMVFTLLSQQQHIRASSSIFCESFVKVRGNS